MHRPRSNVDTARRQRRGFTLLELVVSLSVISLLLALLLPGLMQTRERARSVGCVNNLRQIIAACQTFESAQRRFPSYGLGVGDEPATQTLSGHVELLPFLDQRPVYNQVDFQEPPHSGARGDPPSSVTNQAAITSRVSVFHCPSDDVPTGGTNYVACLGTGPSIGTTHLPSTLDTPSLRGVFSHVTITAAGVIDGLSQTAFYSERLGGDRHRDRFTPWRDVFLISGANAEPFFSDTSPDSAALACRQPIPNPAQHLSFVGAAWLYASQWQTQYNHVLTPNALTPDCAAGHLSVSGHQIHGNVGAATARSFHPGGVNTAFGDGSTRFVANAIDLKVWRALASYAGRQAGEIIVSTF